MADCLSQTRKAPVDVAILDVLAPALIGRDGLDIPARSADLAGTLRALERDGVFGRGVSLLEMCLHDLKAQAAGLPLWRLYCDRRSHPLDVFLVEGYEMAGETDETFAERLQARQAEGYRMMKLEAAHYETRHCWPPVSRDPAACREGSAPGTRFRVVLAQRRAWLEMRRAA